MSSLSIINKTLQEQSAIMVEQTKASERMAVSIDDVREQITRMIETQMSVYDMLENSRERPEFGDRGGPRGLPSPGQGAGGSTGESAGLTGRQNLFNNIFGGLAGGAMTGALGARLLGGVKGLIGKGLKWGLIAFVADQILNVVFENFDVPEELAAELTKDTRRGLMAGATASMLGLRGKWMLIAAAAGFFYDEANKLVDWITENSEAARAAMDWFKDKTGLDGGPLASAVLGAAGGWAAWEGGKRLLGGARSLAWKGLKGASSLAWKGVKAAPQLIQRAGARLWHAAKAATPTVLNTSRNVAAAALPKGGMPIGRMLGGPAAALVIATLTPSELSLDPQEQLSIAIRRLFEEKGQGALKEVRDLLNSPFGQAQIQIFGGVYPEWQKILSDDTFARQYASSIYNSPNNESRERPTGIYYGDSNMLINRMVGEYMRKISPEGLPSPDLVRNRLAMDAQALQSAGNNKPQVVVVPVPTPAPAAPSRAGAGGSAVFTAPIGTTDRLDHRDRISRPW